MNHVPMNLRRLVADVLPKGFEVARAGEDEPQGGYAYFYVTDPDQRRRTFSHATPTLDELYGEIRKLAVEVRRLDYWKRKSEISDADIDALVESVCTNMPKFKNQRWGYAAQAMTTPCCGTKIPAGKWWIHEDAGMLGQFAPIAANAGSPDVVFMDAQDFARYLIERKESRFERSVRQ